MGSEELKNFAELVVPLAWMETLIRESERARAHLSNADLEKDMAEAFTEIEGLRKDVDDLKARLDAFECLTDKETHVHDELKKIGARKSFDLKAMGLTGGKTDENN